MFSWMAHDLINGKSTLMNLGWLESMTPYGVARSDWVKARCEWLILYRQHFQCISVIENILTQIWMYTSLGVMRQIYGFPQNSKAYQYPHVHNTDTIAHVTLSRYMMTWKRFPHFWSFVPFTDGFPSQRDSNVEFVFFLWWKSEQNFWIKKNISSGE